MNPDLTMTDARPLANRLLWDRLFILATILVLHLLLGYRYPIIYGGDTIIRLVNYPIIQIAYQLPLLQVMIHWTMRWFQSPHGIWTLMGLISGAAGAGLHALTWEITHDRMAARLASLFFICHPFVLFYSRVPYQEPLLMACLSWGFCFLFRSRARRNVIPASVCFGLASFTRYEGWIAAVVAFLYYIWREGVENKGFSWRAAARSAALFGWAPAVWILWQRGLSPGGTFVVDAGFEWGRLYRPYFVTRTVIWWTGSAVATLMLFGILFSIRGVQERSIRLSHAVLGFFLSLFLIAMVISAHGIEPDPVRLVTEREAFVPIGILLMYAGAGASRLVHAISSQFPASPGLGRAIPLALLLLIAALGAARGIQRIRRANFDPEVHSAFQVARFLAERNARALILAKPLPSSEIENYLSRAERKQGKEGREKAQEMLNRMETTPLDYQRVLAFSWRGRENILPARQIEGLGPAGILQFFDERRVEYLVVFPDFSPIADHEKFLVSSFTQGATPAAVFAGASLYRLRP